MNDDFVVRLPGGGPPLALQSAQEVDWWQTLEARYHDEYELRKINDLTNLATLLVQQMNLYRAQQALNGRLPQIDEDGLPTGRYETKVLKAAEIKSYQEQITTASKEIRDIEKAMGVDKASREKAGTENNRAWLTEMKGRAHRYSLHVSKRVTKYEEFVMELRWRVRLNEIGDAEDKNYESVDDAGVIRWLRAELAALEEADRKYAHEEGAFVVGSVRP